jgi:ATP-dependent helicase/nuclease subunit B
MQFPQSALSLLDRGGQLITANARSARDLRHFHGEHQAARAQQDAWASPQIYDWHSWLAEMWQRLLLTGTESRLLLSGPQEEFLWASIIRPEVETRSLISPQEVARLARTAWERLATYGGLARLRQGPWGAADNDRSNTANTQEPELFRRWAIEFERRCQRNGWLSSAVLPWVIAEAIAQRTLEVPAEIAWSGFDRTTPAEAALRAALEAAGGLQSDAASDRVADPRRIAAQASEQEIEACAQWARDLLRDRSDARIGILLPNPADVRAQLDRVFRRILMPASTGLRVSPERPLYEFTLGLPLGDVPMVRSALLLLQWMAAPIEREQISWLLASGFFALSEDTTALAVADTKLQQEELMPPEMSLGLLLARLERAGNTAGAVGRWASAMRQAKAIIHPLLDRDRSCRQWVDAIADALRAAGWPGTRAEDSVSFQVRDRWHDILVALASLDFAGTRLSYGKFLGYLLSQAHSALFTAESEDAPVSISGVLESAGRLYDAVWVLQATDDAWPIRSSAHSMLPQWLQAELAMPRGDAQQDAAFSSAVFKRLQQSSSQLVFSYAREGANGPQRPAPLLAAITEENTAAISEPRSLFLAEAFEDTSAIAWPGGAHEAGGQDTLKMQAACPFQAFAVKRLGTRDQRSSAHGLDAAQRGILLHNVLHTLWNDPRMKSSIGLHALVASNILAPCIEEHVDRWLGTFAADGSEWTETYLQLERQRLCTLIDSWLMLELDRPPFEVEKTEQTNPVEIAGLKLRIRLDRVDRLVSDEDSAGRILLDYKTGDANSARWMGPRIDEPQLPLYAVAGKVDALRDVFFAQLRPGKLCFTGSGADSQALVSVNATAKSAVESAAAFNAALGSWREWLDETSRQFQDGLATVDPKKEAETCRYCPLGSLCRVAETGHAPALQGDGEEL